MESLIGYSKRIRKGTKELTSMLEHLNRINTYNALLSKADDDLLRYDTIL